MATRIAVLTQGWRIAAPDDKGTWKGLDIDFCKAVAVAVFGDPSKIRYKSLNAKERFTALQSSGIDLLARNTTWNFSRDVDLSRSLGLIIMTARALWFEQFRHQKCIRA